MTLLFKRATASDIDILVETRIEVLRAANHLSEDIDMSLVEEKSYEYYNHCFDAGDHVAYLVYDGKNFAACGGVSFYKVMPTYNNPSGINAYVMNMYTRPEYRRKGIANEVLDLLLKEAVTQDIKRITLEATDAGKPVYMKYGFIGMKDEMIYLSSH